MLYSPNLHTPPKVQAEVEQQMKAVATSLCPHWIECRLSPNVPSTLAFCPFPCHWRPLTNARLNRRKSVPWAQGSMRLSGKALSPDDPMLPEVSQLWPLRMMLHQPTSAWVLKFEASWGFENGGSLFSQRNILISLGNDFFLGLLLLFSF